VCTRGALRCFLIKLQLLIKKKYAKFINQTYCLKSLGTLKIPIITLFSQHRQEEEV